MGKVSEKLGPSSTRIVGLLCIVAAGFIFSVAFGWLQTDKYAPDWIIVLFGIAFLAAGLFVWILPHGQAQRSAFSDFIYSSAGTIIFVAFATISHWIAFGPGERQSESNLSLPIGWLDRHAGDLETRIFFGFGAVVLDLLILRGLFHLIQERRLRRRG